MAFSSSSSSPLSAQPNVTPLIDVLLVLLIIFMVIVPVAPHGLQSLLPDTSLAPPPIPPAPLTVEVLLSPDPAAGVRYRIAGRDLRLPELRQALRDAVSRSSSTAILVAADQRLDYGLIAGTVAEAHHAGFQSIGLLAARR